MALVPLRLLLDHAAENGYGIPAFNVNNLEQVQAIMEAAYETDSPVILQASRGARNYAGEIFLRHLILAAPMHTLHRAVGGDAADVYTQGRFVWCISTDHKQGYVLLTGSTAKEVAIEVDDDYNPF